MARKGSEDTGSALPLLDKDSNPRLWSVAFYTLAACFGALQNGFALGYSSATLTDLNNLSSSDPHHVSSDSSFNSLFAAFLPIGALIGGPVAGFVADHLGRKSAIMLGGLPFALGWFLLSASNYPPRPGFLGLLESGRFLTGFATGWTSLCVPLYISEISTAKQKGLFGACQQLFITIGIFLVEILGYFLSYYYVSLVALALVVVFELLLLFTKESPRWLIAHGKADEAESVLHFLRGPAANVSYELGVMKSAIESQPQLSFWQVLREYRHRHIHVPILLAFGLSFFQQLSGINAAIFYAANIFQQASVPNPTLVVALAVGIVQVVFTLVGVALVDLAGRKILLIVGAVLLVISSGLLGVELILKDKLCHGAASCHFAPMAIVGLIMFIIAFSIGWGAIPWLMMSELIPQRVRGISNGLVTAANWSLAAIVTGAFTPYSNAVHPWFTWWSFSILMLISIPFVFFLLPETKGRSLEEMEEYFYRKFSREGLIINNGSGSVNKDE